MKKITLFLISGLFAINSIAASVEAPKVNIGDRWQWQHTNALVNEKDISIIDDVIDVKDSEIKVRERIKGSQGFGVGTFTTEWNPKDVGNAKYDPCLRIFKFPLTVGDKWVDTSDKRLLSNGSHGKFTIKGEVLANEEVATPSGTFNAYKVKLIIDAVGTDENAVVGHTVDTYWYAPEVKNYVRLEHVFTRDGIVRNNDIRELQDYMLQ